MRRRVQFLVSFEASAGAEVGSGLRIGIHEHVFVSYEREHGDLLCHTVAPARTPTFPT